MFDFDALEEITKGVKPDTEVTNENFDHIPDVDLVKQITVGMKRYDGSRPEDGWFHPSELEGCSVSVWFNKVFGRPDNKKAEFSPIGKMAVTLGHAVHEMLENAMYRSDVGLSFKHEVPLECEKERIKGTTDGIVEIDGFKYILEFKSCKSEWFDKYKYIPDFKHVKQVHCYMYMTGIRVAYIIYYNKNDNKMAQHRVEFKNSIWLPIVERIRSIRASVLQRTIPKETAYIGCDVLNSPNKRCANYKRCLDYNKKGDLPEKEDCLVQ